MENAVTPPSLEPGSTGYLTCTLVASESAFVPALGDLVTTDLFDGCYWLCA